MSTVADFPGSGCSKENDFIALALEDWHSPCGTFIPSQVANSNVLCFHASLAIYDGRPHSFLKPITQRDAAMLICSCIFMLRGSDWTAN